MTPGANVRPVRQLPQTTKNSARNSRTVAYGWQQEGLAQPEVGPAGRALRQSGEESAGRDPGLQPGGGLFGEPGHGIGPKVRGSSSSDLSRGIAALAAGGANAARATGGRSCVRRPMRMCLPHSGRWEDRSAGAPKVRQRDEDHPFYRASPAGRHRADLSPLRPVGRADPHAGQRTCSSTCAVVDLPQFSKRPLSNCGFSEFSLRLRAIFPRLGFVNRLVRVTGRF